MNYILILLISSGVIAAVSGDPPECETCEVVGEGVKTCKGEVLKCENEDDFCIQQIEQNILPRGNLTTVRKRCMKAEDKKLCDQKLALNATVKYFDMYSECCFDKEGCDLGEIETPKSENKPNGYECVSCFAEGEDECTDENTIIVKCVDDQEECFNFKGTGARPGEKFINYQFGGCVTTHSCTFNLKDLPGSEFGKGSKYDCTPAIKSQ